jgi:hypothetical protein
MFFFVKSKIKIYSGFFVCYNHTRVSPWIWNTVR